MDTLDAEIFTIGVWNGLDFNETDLKVIVHAFDSLKEVHKVPLKFGHNKEQEMTDGQPALGWVSKVWIADDKIMARFIDLPKEVFSAMEKKLYRHVSVELDMGVEHKGNYYSWVLSGVALLGADIPAVNTLADLTTYMSKDELAFTKRITFTAIHNKSDRSNNMDPLKEENETLKATITALKAEVSKLVNSNTSLEKDVFQLKADAKSFEAADEHRQRLDSRSNLETKLDGLVKEKKITPATREEFMRDFDDAEDTKMILFAVDKMQKTIESNPAYFGAEQARKKAEQDRHDGELSADTLVLNRTNEYMAKHGEKNFSVAKQAVLKADTDLANRYTKLEG